MRPSAAGRKFVVQEGLITTRHTTKALLTPVMLRVLGVDIVRILASVYVACETTMVQVVRDA